jgi:hypothetical protein
MATAFMTGWPTLYLSGTDWLVVLTLLLVILALVGVYIAWRHYRLAQRTSEPEATLIIPMPSESGKNIDMIPDPRDYPRDEFDRPPRGPISIAPPFPSLNQAAPKVEESALSTDRQTSVSPRPKKRKSGSPPPERARARWVDLIDETVTVPAGYGQHWATRLDLDGGNEIRGTLTEVDDDDFSYLVLDETNYAAFRRGDDFEAVDEAEETSSVRVDFSVGETNRYYLVLYAYGKRNDREVEVSLRVRTRNPLDTARYR